MIPRHLSVFLTILLCILSQFSRADSIEKITVTASRDDSSLSQLSSNLSVIGSQQIDGIQAEHINQVMARVPGAWISRGNGQEHLTAIRSPVLTGAGGCGAFFIAQDGISARASGFCNTNQLFDLNSEQAASIEVLRGPASVLFGSNAVHGVVNLVTPEIEQLAPFSVALESGPHDYLRTKISTAKQYQFHGYALQFNGTHDGGYLDDSGYEQQKLTLIHQYQHDTLKIKNVFSASNLNQETAGFIQGFQAYRDPALKRQNPNPEAFRDSKSARAYSKIKLRTEQGNTLTLTPYVRWAQMEFLQHFVPWQPNENNSQRSIGVQAQYSQNLAQLALLTGVDVDFTRGELQEYQAQSFSPAIPAGQHYDYQVDAQVLSPFAILRWQANEQLRLSSGIRFEDTRYKYDNRLGDGDACESDVSGCRFTRPVDQVVSFAEWSMQLGFNYAVAAQQHFYGQWSNGYRAPQTTELFRLQAGQQSAELSPETMVGIELGLRGATNILSYDISLFKMQKDHFIFQDTNRQNISNGRTSHQGIELQVNAQLTEHWYARFSGSLAKHRYENDLNISSISILDNEIDTAPEHLASAQIGWKNASGHSVELDWAHTGNYFLNPENSASYSGHNLLSLRSSVRLSEQINISLRVINLTNTDYAERADFAFGNYRYFVGEPRSVYLNINLLME
ncbi:TonB-dependent receptor [Aliiglaciecola sp. LCG003]|uniref:TonB-dependent receptor n=1 Tax=Aliiglaciecola sp. LCG003 TaxID=3053655 RepID=UPI002573C18F|nr:TonB-dependent receptor [Aliiglaciecola sp. LCG003]WJG09814.1 TonB-dependent receptor [Aliiglaciecola sp. LCG003]